LHGIIPAISASLSSTTYCCLLPPLLCARTDNSRQENQHHAVAAKEEFADEAVAVDRLALLSVCIPGRLAPHLLDVLQHHVAVAVEGFDARQQLAVVARRDQDLSVVAHGRLEEREGARGEFVGFEEGELVFAGSFVS
jgi:hypothetical protein